MGLFDWLTDGLGGSMTQDAINAGGSMATPYQTMAPPPPPPSPPPLAKADRLPLPPPTTFDPSTLDVSGGMQNGGGGSSAIPPVAPPSSSPPAAPPPLPVPRPNIPSAGPAATPPATSPTSGGTGMPPGAPFSMAPPQAPPTAPGSPTQTALGRALGISPDQAGEQGRQIMRGIGKGLASVGQNWNKPGAAAFAASAGAAMGGGAEAADKSFDERLKALKTQIDAQSGADKATVAGVNLEIAKARLENEKLKMTPGVGKAWNKPDSQKYTDARHNLNSDPAIKAAAGVYKKAVDDYGVGSTKANEAHDALETLTAEKEKQFFAEQGLDPAKAAAIAQNPPGTQANPHTITSEEDFKKSVKPGEYYINPKDGKPYVRNGAGDTASTPGVPAAPTAPPPAASSPTPAVKNDDEEED